MNDVKYFLAFYQQKNPWLFISRIIMFLEKRDTSHCEILEVTNNDLENGLSYGSVWPKSRVKPYREMKKHYTCKRVIPLKVTNDSNAHNYLKSLIGIDFSFLQIVAIGIKIIFGSFIKLLAKTQINLSKYLICTEYCGIFMHNICGYELTSSPDMLELDEIEDIALKNLMRLDNDLSSN